MKTASVCSQRSFHSIWICRVNITIIICKEMENDCIQKWVLECKLIILALGGGKCAHCCLCGICPQSRVVCGGSTKQQILRDQAGVCSLFIHSSFVYSTIISWVPTICHSVRLCGYNRKQSNVDKTPAIVELTTYSGIQHLTTVSLYMQNYSIINQNLEWGKVQWTAANSIVNVYSR